MVPQDALYFRGTRHYPALPPAQPNRAPERTRQTAPDGTRPGTALPDCVRCEFCLPCNMRQRLNYQMGLFALPFWLSDCEAALTGSIDLPTLLQQGTYTLPELVELTGKCLATLWRELRALRDQGINIVAYGSRGEAHFGCGPAAAKPVPDNRQRVLDALRQHGPCMTATLAEITDLHIALVRRVVRQLHATGAITCRGKARFVSPSGIIRQAPLWQSLD